MVMGGLVILNYIDYCLKLDSIISVSSKFAETPENTKIHPIIIREQWIRKN